CRWRVRPGRPVDVRATVRGDRRIVAPGRPLRGPGRHLPEGHAVNPADRAAAQLLRDVADGHVYQVRQRSATYAQNGRTGRRCTREVRPLVAAGLVVLNETRRDGSTLRFEMTDVGRRQVALFTAGPTTRSSRPTTRRCARTWPGCVRRDAVCAAGNIPATRPARSCCA